MEIRKILDLLEAAPPQAGAVGMFGKNPNAPAANSAAAAPQSAGKPVVGTGLVAGSETQGGQVSYGAGASAQRSAAPKPVAAASNAPPASGTPFTNPTPNVAAAPAPTPANPAPAPKPAAAPAPAQTKTYGGGYDPTKVQYAYGGPTASAQQSAASDASKKNAFGGATQTAQQPTVSATQSAALDTAKTGAIGGTTQPAAPTPVATAPTQTSDQIATAALNAPAQDTSGTSLGRQAGFGKMAEDGTPAPNTPQQTAPKTKKLPTVRDIVKADKKEIEDQFTDPNKESPYNKDTRSIGPASKPVNTIADFEESVDHELAEMLRLSGLPLNEKAVSKQQQKFMGMVHAMQKGEKVKGASVELKKAAKGMSKKDAKDFASTKHKGLPKKVTEGFKLMLDEEGHTLEHIVNRFKHEVKKFLDGDMMSENLYDALYDYYLDRGELPYGIAKGREGDPYAWTVDRFYNDITADNMNEDPVYEVAGDDTLQRLAELAGLEEDGPGQFGMQKKPAPKSLEMTPTQPGVEPVSQFAADLGMPPLPFFSKKEKADYEAMKARKAERQFQQSGSAYSDAAGVRYNSRGEPMEYLGLRSKDYFDPKPNRDRDLYNMQHDQAAKNIQKESVDLNECGDMGMDTEDKFNVSTNMSSDGTRSVNISAQGDRADDLLQMLKMAGMRPHDDHNHEVMSEPVAIMIGSDDEMMEQELEEARKKRTTRYVNTPDEEYQTVASITRQGNDLNREKKQFAGKPRLGDNPMAESALDVDLDAMLESILIREQDSKIEYDEVEQRVKADFPAPKRRDPSVQELPLQNQEYHGPRSLKVDGEQTGTKNYRDDDEKEIYEKMDDLDEQGSNQPNPYPVGQDALTPQQKLNPTNNPNKSIVRGIKDFIMNPLKPGM